MLAEIRRHNFHMTNSGASAGPERSHLLKKCQQLGIDCKSLREARMKLSAMQISSPLPPAKQGKITNLYSIVYQIPKEGCPISLDKIAIRNIIICRLQ